MKLTIKEEIEHIINRIENTPVMSLSKEELIESEALEERRRCYEEFIRLLKGTIK
jgi:hypothetical protein